MSAPDLTRKVIGFRTWVHTGGIPLRQEEVQGAGYTIQVPTREAADDDRGLWSRIWAANHLRESYWPPGISVARCRAGRYSGGLVPVSGASAPSPHIPPHPLCTCGLYAHHEVTRLRMTGLNADGVGGAIAAWGQIEAHRNVFRAQFAEPVVLAYDPAQGPGERRIIDLVADRYGLPVVLLDDLEDAAREFGEPMPPGFRGTPNPDSELTAPDWVSSS